MTVIQSVLVGIATIILIVALVALLALVDNEGNVVGISVGIMILIIAQFILSVSIFNIYLLLFDIDSFRSW